MYKPNNNIIMKAPKVVLKNVKTFQGHEGYGLNADVYINGINCMLVIDDANGGEFMYHENTHNNPKADQVRANIKLLDDYIATLPEEKSDIGGKEISIKIDRDIFIDDVLAKQEKAKEQKKMERKMQTCILFGVPDGDRYGFLDFKEPLISVPQMKLMVYVSKILNEKCKDGIKILNTNFKVEDGKVIFV